MEKLKVYATLLLVLSLASSGVQAFEGFAGFKDPVMKSEAIGTGSKGKSIEGTIPFSEKSCEINEYKNKISLSALQMLMGGSKQPYSVTLVPKENPEEAIIVMKPYLKGCVAFSDSDSIKTIFDADKNNFAISFDNKKKDSFYKGFIPAPTDRCDIKKPIVLGEETDSTVIVSAEEFKEKLKRYKQIKYVCKATERNLAEPVGSVTLSQKQKIDLCLLSLTDGNGNFVTKLSSRSKVVPDSTKIARKFFSNRGNYKHQNTFKIKLTSGTGDTKKPIYDPHRAVKVLHGSYISDPDYFVAPANSQMNTAKDCMKYEEISKAGNSGDRPGYYMISPEQAAISGVENVCITGSSADIEKEVTNLSRQTGNYSNLEKNLISKLQKMLKVAGQTREVQERSSEIDALYERLADLKEDCGERGLKADDRDTIEECASDYTAVISRLEIYIDKDKAALAKLHKNYRDAKDSRPSGQSKKDFDKEYYEQVTVLQERVGRYAKDKNKFGYRKVMDNFEKFGLADTANNVAKFLLTSAEWSKVSPVKSKGRKKYSPKKATKKIAKNLKRYKKEISGPKAELYESGTGVARHSSKYRDSARDLEKSRRNWYQSKVVKNEQKWAAYCQRSFGFQRNPKKCQKGQRERGRRMSRYEAINGKYMKEIGRNSGLYTRLNSVEREFSRRNPAGEEEGNGGYFNSFNLFNGSSESFFGDDDDVGGEFSDHGSFSSNAGTFQDPWAAQMSMNGPNPYNYNNQQQFNQNMNGNINYRQQPGGGQPQGGGQFMSL